MLKRLTILAVLLAITQAVVPVPRQAANSPTQRPEQSNQSTCRAQSPSASPSFVPYAVKPNPPAAPTERVHSEDAEQPITISKPVAVSVSRDWLDYATWLGALALVVVGVLGIWLANRTLKAVEKQADLMKSQSDFMLEKERAKLRIELDHSGPIKDEFGCFNIRGWLSIYGNSEAFIRHSVIYASIGPAGIFNPLPEWTWGIHNVPDVIKSNVKPAEFSVMVMGEDGPATDEEIKAVSGKKAEIYCMAKVEFTDTYGRCRELRLRQRFTFAWYQELGAYLAGGWENSGPETDNGEYRIECQPQKPNLGHYPFVGSPGYRPCPMTMSAGIALTCP